MNREIKFRSAEAVIEFDKFRDGELGVTMCSDIGDNARSISLNIEEVVELVEYLTDKIKQLNH